MSRIHHHEALVFKSFAESAGELLHVIKKSMKTWRLPVPRFGNEIHLGVISRRYSSQRLGVCSRRAAIARICADYPCIDPTTLAQSPNNHSSRLPSNCSAQPSAQSTLRVQRLLSIYNSLLLRADPPTCYVQTDAGGGSTGHPRRSSQHDAVAASVGT